MKKNKSLLPMEEQIIRGSLLGDAHLRKDRNVLIFAHGENQLEYLKWKHNALKSIANDIYKTDIQGGYIRYNFNTKSINDLKDFRIELYKNGQKVVTRKYLNKLTPLGLAVWWMDDGCLIIQGNGSRVGKLCTHSFTLKENEIIKKYFKTVWDIDCTIKMEKNKYYWIRFNSTNLKKLLNIIYPHVLEVPSMHYKIDMKYKNNVKGLNFALPPIN